MKVSKRTGAIVIFGLSLAAYALLAIFAPNADPRGVFIFAGMGAAWLGLHGENEQVRQRAEVIEQKTEVTAKKIDQIHKQTNGVLDQRIEEGVRKVLTEMFAEHDRNKVHTVVVTKEVPAPPRKRTRLPRPSPKGEN